jgi:hypothetical protein
MTINLTKKEGLFSALTPSFEASKHPFNLDYSRVESAAGARRQRVKLYCEYCEPFATKQMRPDRLARRVKTPDLEFGDLRRQPAFL